MRYPTSSIYLHHIVNKALKMKQVGGNCTRYSDITSKTGEVLISTGVLGMMLGDDAAGLIGSCSILTAHFQVIHLYSPSLHLYKPVDRLARLVGLYTEISMVCLLYRNKPVSVSCTGNRNAYGFLWNNKDLCGLLYRILQGLWSSVH